MCLFVVGLNMFVCIIRMIVRLLCLRVVWNVLWISSIEVVVWLSIFVVCLGVGVV